MRNLGFSGAALLVAAALAVPAVAQTPKSPDTGTSTVPTGNQISNGGKGSGTGTPDTGSNAEAGKNGDQVGVNKGAGSGTGTMKPAGTNADASKPAQ